MKKKNCKHHWMLESFSPSHFNHHTNYYNCYVNLKCTICVQVKRRLAEPDEFALERQKQFCKFCDELNSAHDPSLLKVDSQLACMRILFGRLRRIEERLKDAEIDE